MSILYSTVSRGTVVLARYAKCAGNFSEVTDQILSKIPVGEPIRMSYVHASYLFHYVSENGIIYLCIADSNFSRDKAFMFLEDIKVRFNAEYSRSLDSALPYAMNSSFAPILASQMKHYSENGETDRIARLQGEVSGVKDILVQNIEQLSTRGEKLELLINKTENLNNSAVTFKSSSRAVSRAIWWRNIRLTVYILLGLAVSIYVIGAMACGMTWKGCTS